MTQHISFMDTAGHWHCVNVADIVHLAENGEPARTVVYVRAPGYGHPGWEIHASEPMTWFENRLAVISRPRT